MAKMPKSLQSWLLPKLRQISRWWPAANIALDAAKVKIQVGYYQNGRPEYRTKFKCATCQELYERDEVQRDHIQPVIDVKGHKDWNETLENMFCNPEGYQILCKSCHFLKTSYENERRQENRKINKKVKK